MREKKMESGWRRRGEKEKKKREGEPPKWLLSCFKLVISVIRGKSIAEACSIRGNGDSLSLSGFLPLSVTFSLIISSLLPLMCLFKDPSIFSCAARAEKRPPLFLHTSSAVLSPLTSKVVIALLAWEASCVPSDTFQTF